MASEYSLPLRLTSYVVCSRATMVWECLFFKKKIIIK